MTSPLLLGRVGKMNHEEIKILISAYIDGEVTPSEKDIVENHIVSCPSCQKEFDEFKKVSASLKRVPQERLSPDVELNIKGRLASTKEKTMEKQELSIQWSSVVIVVAVMAFSVLAMQNYAQRGLQGRVRDASMYLAKQSKGSKSSETYAFNRQPSSVWFNKGIQGRLKSATDDIGDQFSAGNTAYHRNVAQSSVRAVSGASAMGVSSEKLEGTMQLAAMTTPAAKAGDRLMESKQYEPYYSASNYLIARGENGAVQSFDRVRASNGFQTSNYPVESDMVVYSPQYYPYQPANTESYDQINENGFFAPNVNPLSTFSIDVDTASYSNVRRFLNQGQLPPQDAVRVEEMINYFTYDYPEPMWGQPFSITTEIAPCPWNPSHQLALIGLQGKRLNALTMPASNLVFLIDVSGSMSPANRLPLLQDAFRMMTHELEGKDKVSIVVYAGAAGLVLDATPGNYKERILSAIDQLRAGGSTAGGAGIQLAYQIARNNFIANGNNRVILATDGDFNVGISSDSELTRMIEDYRDQGIYLTVLGFGEGNLKDSKMEKLADKGNGNYFYIDTRNEARKVLVHELGSTLFTIAKDVKIQVEFNPATVQSYRLVGYENRMLAKEDFNDDTKDAGELGAGHTVTALYEIIPADGYETMNGRVDPLVYQKNQQAIRKGSSDVMTVKLRYKDPKSTTSKLIKKTVGKHDIQTYAKSDNFRFASSVAEFGLLLRNSPYRGQASFDHVLSQARAAKPDDFGYRSEFYDLVEKARALSPYVTPILREEPTVYWGQNDTRSQGKAQK